MDIELMKFGKFLLRELKIPSKRDWEEIIRKYHMEHLRVRRGVHSINQHISWFFDQDPLEVKKSKSRKENLILAKHVTMYFAITMYELKVKELADFYDCGTANVSSSCRKVSNRIDTDNTFRKQIEALKILIL